MCLCVCVLMCCPRRGRRSSSHPPTHGNTRTTSSQRGIRRPIAVAPGYDIVPVSNLGYDPADKPKVRVCACVCVLVALHVALTLPRPRPPPHPRQDQYRKMKATMGKMRSEGGSSNSISASKLSIEGRGV
jgi:hypothetical protein